MRWKAPKAALAPEYGSDDDHFSMPTHCPSQNLQTDRINTVVVGNQNSHQLMVPERCELPTNNG
jgi:hypothetical protein